MAPSKNTYRCEVCNKDKRKEGFAYTYSTDGKRRLDTCADCQNDAGKADKMGDKV